MATYNQINSKMIEATINHGEQIYARRGAMLAYTGQVNFHPTTTAGQGLGGFVGRMVAGEQVPLMVSEGMGTVFYGHGGMQTKIVQLQGDQLTVEADKLLCYDSGLQAGTMFLGQQGGLRSIVQGQMTGQGLFTTQLTGHGQAVLLSHGPVFELQVSGAPVSVDPQAYVGHKGMHRHQARLQRRLARRGRPRLGRGLPDQVLRTGHRLRPGLGDEVLMSITTYNPNTLPVDDNINAYSFCVDLNGQYFVQKGRMIAYYGQMKFESLNAGPLSGLIAAHFSAPLYHNEFMVAIGQREADHRRPRVRHQLL